jgi:aspartyl protease family protein
MSQGGISYWYCILGCALAIFPVSAATLYKCQGIDKQMRYQDHECLYTQRVKSWEMKVADKAAPVQAGAYVVVLANQYNAYQLPGLINDVPVQMIVDTGASLVALPIKIAEKLKVGCGAKVPLHTANGMTLACTGMVRSLQIGNLQLHNIEVMILPNDASSLVLLGGSALKRLKVVQLNGEMRLSSP